MNSYQKLKQRVAELERDLHVVCTSPMHPQALEIIGRVKHSAKWGEIVTMGSRDSLGSGLLGMIEHNYSMPNLGKVHCVKEGKTIPQKTIEI